MGAKFKAPLDSRCFAEMEEQHFRLPLPPCVCLSFALLSFPASISLSLLPSIFHPPFLWEEPPLYVAPTPSLQLFFLCYFLLLLPCLFLLFFCQYLILRYIRFSAALLFSRPPSLYLNPAFIIYASLSNLTDIDQYAAAGMLSWCKFVQRAPSNPGSKQSLEQWALKRQPLVQDRQLLSTALQISARIKNPSRLPLFLSSRLFSSLPLFSFEDGTSTNV